ncbi:FAD-dependent oxidoreductase [Pseudohoeflea coraliihabitans]|uniref:FAD-dependent oxidoreductase n=1 Tax=Pseudohoeflea coraliihabitans TaxID=2860393 RepID=A0ABS6WQ94_9HYPH|nr:FAD-dependent oxidoreductase [Pseudohoeflea sp. DP4N28-3]MBW3097230.1 FAD-dependent oxidoreductase [Pseudohoeflea sp. DP4N28-3]
MKSNSTILTKEGASTPFDPRERPDLSSLREVDLIILGSGAAGLTAALTGLLAGLQVVVLEKAPVLGGTSARSSGTVWIPDNQYMRAAGISDDRTRAATYLEKLVGARGPRQPWEVFLDTAPRMEADLAESADIRFRPMPTAADYRSEIDGAGEGWRPLEPLPFDGRKLGGYFSLLAPPIRELTVFGGMMVSRAEAGELIHFDRSPRAALKGARLTLRYLRDRISYNRGTRLVMGNGLVGRLLWQLLRRDGLIWENVTVTSLERDGDRINGVQYALGTREGMLKARRGVVLAGGGYPSSGKWRESQLPKPTPRYTPAAPHAAGSSVELGLAAGAALGPPGLDNGLWFPSSIRRRKDGSLAVYPHIVLDRAKPGCIIVDSQGQRFANEALSYHDFVRSMYVANADVPCIPAWLIGDRDFLRRYGMGIVRPRTPFLGSYRKDGYLKYGADIAGLAQAINVPADALRDTIARFNSFAARGVDEDFGRGTTVYQRANGDPRHKPNPCLGPVGSRELYAVELHPTPLGTSRGLAASPDGEVLDETGAPIPGLYVCGNDMQSCFSGEYPGAGAQIGMGMTFGWRVARHAAGKN